MSDLALLASAALMGLAGTPHCAAMCGAACGGVARRCGGAQHERAAGLALQLGRIAGYAAAGALLAAGIGGIGRFVETAPWLRPWWTLWQASLLALGLWLLWRGAAPAWWRTVSAQPMIGLGRSPRPALAALIGVGWVALPCGLLQSALLVAAFASGPWQGAAVMAAFGAATSIGLQAAPWLVRRLVGLGRGGAPAVRLSGAVLIAVSGYALLHGLQLAIAGWCATPG